MRSAIAPHRLLHLFALTFLLTAPTRPASAQQPLGVGRLELYVIESRRFDEIPANVRDRTFPTIQDALDSTDKPVAIYVYATNTPGFAAVSKDVQVAFVHPCIIEDAVTFVDCKTAELRPNGDLGTWTARRLVAFVRSKNLYANKGTAAAAMAIENCEDGLINCGIDNGLHINHSTGIAVASLIQGLGIAIADCVADTKKNETARGNWPIAVGGSTFQNIRAGPALIAYRSKVYANRNTAIDLPARGFEFDDCPDTWVTTNELKGVNDLGIAYYDSSGLCETNAINANRTGTLNDGVYVLSSTPDKPNRCKVEIKQNTINRADRGIVSIASTVRVYGNDANDPSLVGVAIGLGSDGSIEGAGVTNGRLYGIYLYQLKPGFRLEKSRMRTTATGIVLVECNKITLFSNRWQAGGPNAGAIVYPVTTSALLIGNCDDVTLDYNSFASKMSSAGLIISGSTVTCTNIDEVISVTGNEGYESAVTSTGPAIYISSSTVKGTLTATADDTALIAASRSDLTLENPAFSSIFAPAVVLYGQSSLVGNQGRIIGAQPRGQARAVQPTADDTISLSGGSRIRLNHTGIGNFGARATLHLLDGCSATLDACQINGTRVGDAGNNLLATLRLFDGDYDGILVEGKDASAQITGGLLQLQSGDNVRARRGGKISLSGVKLALGEHNVHVESGGVVELDGCTLDNHQSYDPEKTGASLRVDSGGVATGKSLVFTSNPTALRVARDGKCLLEGGTISNGPVGVRAEEGAAVKLSSVRFVNVTKEVIGQIDRTP